MKHATETFEAAHLYGDRFALMIGANTVTLSAVEMVDLIDLLIQTPRETAGFASHVDTEFVESGDDYDAALVMVFLGPHVTLNEAVDMSGDAGYAVAVAIECNGHTEVATLPRIAAWQVLHEAVDSWLAVRNG